VNQILHAELSETFFHQLVRRILREERYKAFMETDSLL
jgi:23S rRNA pseudoU1915 N3-methylase RlmH